jgi:predicted dehydrogenase
MEKPITIVLVGIGGMGSVYIAALLEKAGEGLFQIVGAVDPSPERCPHLAELKALNVALYNSLEKFYAQRKAELAIISSPIHFHCPQTCLALGQGSYVLCEKPVSATIQEAKQMMKARDKAMRWVAIGYQWSFSTAILELKKDIQKGILGKAKRLNCLYLWPRNETYYRRNDWAGKKCDFHERWILDSPANNAMAHDLHNMLYILGEGVDRSTRPVEVEAELYRAYDIQNFDTAAVRSKTEEGAEILFFVSHASQKDMGPILSYEFEKGTVLSSGRNSDIKALFLDGTVKNYGNPDSEPLKKLWDCLEGVRSIQTPVCGIEAAASHTLCLNGMQDSMPEITEFPRELLRTEGEPGSLRIWVEGLDEVLEQCYREGLLPSELSVPWSKKGAKINLTNYNKFSGG